MNAKTTATRAKRKAISAPAPTIYDGDKYFDAKFTSDECLALGSRIMDECGINNDFQGRGWLMTTIMEAGWELDRKLGMSYGSRPHEWAYIHICRQLEIDYHSFAKNEPKLPIDAFYRVVERKFPQFKPAKNRMQLDVQTHHIHMAFLDWVESACPATGCQKSEHWLWGCSDRFEKPDYDAVVKRIWEHNAARPKLTLVHPRNPSRHG